MPLRGRVGRSSGFPKASSIYEEVWELWATRTNLPLAPALFAGGRNESVDGSQGHHRVFVFERIRPMKSSASSPLSFSC